MRILTPGGGGSSTLTTSNLVQANEYVRVISSNQLPIFNTKVANVKTNNGNARVLLLGDSVTLGRGSFSSGTNRVAWNYSSIAQRYFAQAGTTSQRDAFFGDGAFGPDTNSTYDSRIVPGADWGGFADNSIGGSIFNASVNTSSLVFTPTGVWNTCTVYYATLTTSGVMSVAIGGGSPVTQATAAPTGVAKTTFTGTAPAVQPCTITWSSGAGGIFILGVECWNSTISQLQILNTGWSGATTANVADTSHAYGPLFGFELVAPDLTIIATGINDWLQQTNINTFNTAYQTLITKAKASGDCVALVPPPSDPATEVSQAIQDIYANAIRALAASNNIPTIDIYARFVNFTTSAALYSDGIHPNGPGYEVIGKAMFEFMDIWGAGSANPPSVGIPLLIQTVANNTYTYIGKAGSSGTILGIYEEARALTTAGTFAITINGTNVTGLTAVVPTTAGSYTSASALNTFNRGDKIQVTYSGTSVVLDHTLTLDVTLPLVAL